MTKLEILFLFQEIETEIVPEPSQACKDVMTELDQINTEFYAQKLDRPVPSHERDYLLMMDNIDFMSKF